MKQQHKQTEKLFCKSCFVQSRDTFALWEAMIECDASVKDLAPEVFFTDPIISRQKAKLWAGQVKARLVEWSKKNTVACDKV
jgi:hypothetical protein